MDRLNMKLVYIASPYTIGDVAENVANQEETAHKILDIGHCPIVPLLSHYLHIRRQRKYEDWIKMDMAIIPRVDVVLRLPGESKGADREVELAKELGIRIIYDLKDL